jgi:hypothetical protein
MTGTPEFTIFPVAMAAYRGMKEYGEIIGQPYMPEWDDPEATELRDMAVSSISRMLKHYFEDYRRTGERMVMSPEVSHGLWSFDAMRRGWICGREFSLKDKTNPRLRDFDELDRLSQGKSEVIVSIFRNYLPLLESEYGDYYMVKARGAGKVVPVHNHFHIPNNGVFNNYNADVKYGK